jgi:hypothetical protein
MATEEAEVEARAFIKGGGQREMRMIRKMEEWG